MDIMVPMNALMPSEIPLCRQPVIHIGMPKTATTTLQRRLFAHHSEIYYLGRYPESDYPERFHQNWACLDADIGSAIKNTVYFQHLHTADREQNSRRLRRCWETAAARGQVPVFSWESLATDSLARRRLRARNLRALFGEAKILICLRNPLALIESAYFLSLHRANLNPHHSRWRLPHYRAIDQWIEYNYHHEVKPHLQYAETIQAYAKFFGLANVHVFLFEDLIADAPRFVADLCAVLGIASEEALGLVTRATDNQRFTTTQVEHLRVLSRSPLQALRFACTPPKRRMRAFHQLRHAEGATGVNKAKATISAAWRERIFAEVSEGTRWLKSVYPLHFDGYGYTPPSP